jgi:hypothetical protein
VRDIGTNRSNGPKVSLMNLYGTRPLPKRCRNRIRAVIRSGGVNVRCRMRTILGWAIGDPSMANLYGAVEVVGDSYGRPDPLVCSGISVQGACLER